MSLFRFYFLKNAMMIANFLANFIAVGFNMTIIYSGTETPIFLVRLLKQLDLFLTPSFFLFVGVMTLWYERPIRRFLNGKVKHVYTDEELRLKARQRLLNEPFVLIALDLCMWLLAAILYPILFWIADAGANMIQRPLYMSITTGLITITVAFFMLEYVLQKQLAPYFFPEGKLSQVPKTLRIRIGTRLVAFLLASNVIPLFTLLSSFKRISNTSNNPIEILTQFRSIIYINGFIFIGTGIYLTFLIVRNLTLPFNEILETLRRIGLGLFDKQVRVTSNDEIGFTGDMVNEMTKGLLERDMIRDTFGKYVSNEVRDEILSGRIPLDGEKKEVTILFSDLRDFTPLAERNDPKTVVRMINDYFKEMSEAIKAYGGLILQYSGDEIYAVFGAPIPFSDHPSKAFQAGQEMGSRLNELNKRFLNQGLPIFKHGIGIHTGEALAANIGSPDRLSYTLIGDTVNLASRLQSLTRDLGTEMIISADTHAHLSEAEQKTSRFGDPFLAKIKGKVHPVKVFSIA